MLHIADPADERLTPFRLTDRQLRLQHGWFLAEGDLVVERALAAGCRPVCALVDPQRVPAVAETIDAPLLAAGEPVRRAATRLGVVQPILGVFERPAGRDAATLAAGADHLVVVQAVDNPANVGAIVRNAAALGWDGLVLDQGSADPLARRSLRVAMGTAFRLPWARVDDVESFVSALDDMETFALTPAAGAVDIASVTPPDRVAIVLGSERAGLTDGLLAACDHRVRIPIDPDVDSLNVAAAAAIACHHLRRPPSW